MLLDNTISTPLYQQMAELLQREIESGERPAGSRLPTENELSEHYHVSRVTVRKALAELSQMGYLERKSGKGTFVAEKKIQRALSGVVNFTEMCHILGYTAGARTIRMSIEDPTREESEKLGLGPEEKILVVERIRYANEKPVLLERNTFPESFFFLFDEDLNNTSLYEVIRAKKGIVFTESSKLLEIVFANYQQARYLGISKGYPLLSISSTVRDTSGEHCHLCNQLCIGDKFKLLV